MGHVFEQFGGLTFANEAEVSDKLVVPLFKDFLGYRENELLSERLQPSVVIYLNREIELDGINAKIKPDFMVALDGDPQQVVFSFDSKGPNENLDDHLHQLRAYCISVGKNLVAATNGTEFRVYNANDLVFQAIDLAAFDLQFSELRKLLHREVAHIPLAERIRSLDLNKALGHSVQAIENEQRRRIAVENSDFISYLDIVVNSPDESTLPPFISEAYQIPLKSFPSQELYMFLLPRTELDLKVDEPRTYNHIIQEIPKSSMLIIGESGIGKTSLLTQIAREYAGSCLRYDSTLIPVLVKLGQYTSANNLKVLISNQLGRGNVSVVELEVVNLLRQGRLVLLLDAFDEVIDGYLHDLQQEIENLIRDFHCAFVITTRHFRVPQLSLTTKYELQPLAPQKIRAFSKMYLGADYQGFLNELTRKGLGTVASNTLLLTLLILLYLNSQELPRSRIQIIHAIVKQLEKWAESKVIQRFQHVLPWKIKLDFLSELAFLSFSKGDSYTLGSDDADETLASKLKELEASRKVPLGMQITAVYQQLEDTGLIHHLQDSGVSFWHRALQEYLASFQILERVRLGQIRIGDLIKDPKWETIFPSVAYLTNQPDILILDLLSHNVFAAGGVIIECNLESGIAYEKTVECLKQRCESKQKPIRQLAVNLLRQIGGEYVGEKFRELLESEYLKENGEFEHVRKVALVEIARRKIPNAHDIVYAHLDWHSYTRLEWMSQEAHAGAAVIEALSWLDDKESQQHIVDRWMKKKDFPTQEACRDALIRIANRGTLDADVKRTLLEGFISEPTENGRLPNVVPVDGEKIEIDYWGMQAVFIALHNVDLALQLIPALISVKDKSPQSNCIIEILKTFNEPEIVEALIQQTKLLKNNLVVCARFLDILSEIEAEIPIEVFLDFAQDEIPAASKAYAIRGLGRFAFDRIESTVLAAIHPPSYEKLLETINEYLIGQVLQVHQDAEVIRILTEFASLPSLTSDACVYLQKLLTKRINASELLRQLMGVNTLPDIEWSILTNRQYISSQVLQQAISHLISPLPYEHLLIIEPCDYCRVQDEIFRVLGKYKQIALLAKTENQPLLLYNISSETLFQIIRRDKVFEMESFISSFIDRKVDVHGVQVKRMVIEAAWVLAALGNIEKTQKIVDQTMEGIDPSSTHGDDWVLGDILKGIHMLPPDYALARIQKVWLNMKWDESKLLPHHCIEALESLGNKQALDMLAQIVQETLGQAEYRSEPERALRAIQQISPVGREDWLIALLQQDPQDRQGIVHRVIDMLGMTGSLQALPVLQQYLENHPSERIRLFAFWAIHNIYKSREQAWYDGQEAGCL